MSFKSGFSLDLRSVGLFRIGIGGVALFDCLTRMGDFTAHYTLGGLYPKNAFVENAVNTFLLSQGWNAPNFWPALLFTLISLTSFCLLIGYKSRLMAFLTWVLMVHIHNRNPMVLHSGDVLFRSLLFWAIFLPINARYAIEKMKGEEGKPIGNAYFGGSSIAITLQIAIVYFGSALFKTGKEWWPEGTAAYYALSLEHYTTSFGAWMSNFHGLLRAGTYGVYFLELIGPFFLFAPFCFGPIRTAIVAAFALMHLSFDLTMRLGIFPWVDYVSLIVLLPSWLWDQFLKKPEGATFPLKTNLATQVLSLFFISYISLWNLHTLPKFKFMNLEPWDEIARSLRLDQKWNMFAPFPTKQDGWYVAPAKLSDGTEFDAFKWEQERPKPDTLPTVSFEKPEQVSKSYKNMRWRKYMINFLSKNFEKRRLHYGRYLCRTFNDRHPQEKQLVSFELFFMREKTLPPGLPTKIDKLSMLQHECSEPQKPEITPGPLVSQK
jgi:hypothetical protein